jgi:hypothetical protein
MKTETYLKLLELIDSYTGTVPITNPLLDNFIFKWRDPANGLYAFYLYYGGGIYKYGDVATFNRDLGYAATSGQINTFVVNTRIKEINPTKFINNMTRTGLGGHTPLNNLNALSKYRRNLGSVIGDMRIATEPFIGCVDDGDCTDVGYKCLASDNTFVKASKRCLTRQDCLNAQVMDGTAGSCG